MKASQTEVDYISEILRLRQENRSIKGLVRDVADELLKDKPMKQKLAASFLYGITE